jgi:uncharacterized protein
MPHVALGRSHPVLTFIQRSRYWLLALVAVIVVLFPHVSLSAQTQTAYPPFIDPHVNDYAQILEPTTAASLRSELGQFQAETGVQAVVLTVNSVQDYPTGDQTIESFATNLFNTWGIGDRTRDDGILLLVAVGDREMRLELGSGYASRYDAVAQSIIDRDMIPHFRDGDYNGGILAGARAVIRHFHPSQPAPVPTSGGGDADGLQQVGEVITEHPNTAKAAGGGAAVVTIGTPMLLLWNRHRSRTCSKCGTKMVRLDERQDDKSLNRGQRKEEALGSVDYDVWQCPSCSAELVNRYSNHFSQYCTCPACDYKTLKEKSRTIRRPTYSSTGQREIKQTCSYCNYRGKRYETIPKRTRSSSSSSSSHGGGGSSSGGGASGSW